MGIDASGADASDDGDEDVDTEGDRAAAATAAPPAADAIDDVEDDADAGMDVTDADEGSEEHADVEEDDDASAVGDLGELLREKSFVITFGFDFGACCCCCGWAVDVAGVAYSAILEPLSADRALKL